MFHNHKIQLAELQLYVLCKLIKLPNGNIIVNTR